MLKVDNTLNTFNHVFFFFLFFLPNRNGDDKRSDLGSSRVLERQKRSQGASAKARATMPRGMTAVTLTDTAASAFFSNNIKHAMVKPRVLFDLGDRPNADGLTTKWSIVRKYIDALEELLVLTAGRVPKHALLLKQFISWLQTHGVAWSWKDSDRAMQHLRCMLRSLQSQSLPPGRAPKGYDDLQPLIDKFIDARSDIKDDVSLIPSSSSRSLCQVQISDDERPVSMLKSKKKIAKLKRATFSATVKTESESESDDGLFRKRRDQVQLPRALPKCFQGFPSFANHTFTDHAAIVPVSMAAIVPVSTAATVPVSTAAIVPVSTTAIVPFEHHTAAIVPSAAGQEAAVRTNRRRSALTGIKAPEDDERTTEYEDDTIIENGDEEHTTGTVVKRVLDASELQKLAAAAVPAPTPQASSKQKSDEKAQKAAKKLRYREKRP